MQKKIKTTLLNNVYPLLIFFIALIISILNYDKNTFLIGFDSLHNEFNLLLNIKRNFFGVWQVHQGLGLLGGMSHISDIPRMLVLLILSLVFPINSLRYIWTFAMLILGPLGVYFLSLVMIKGEDLARKKLAAFLAGLFYIFNLSTVQLFFSNFDGFVTHYGFIPWLFLFSYKFITEGRRKDILIFLILSVLGANQAYTGTLFFAFALFLSTFLFIVFIQNKQVIPFKRIVIFVVLWIGVNAFWIFPVGHFIKTSSNVVSKASINIMSSEESYFMNKKYGNIKDVLTLKSFWFDLNDYDNNRADFVFLMSLWSDYLQGKYFILYLYSFLVFLGFIFSFYKKEYRPWSVLFIMSVFFLMAGNGFMGGLFTFFQGKIPLFKEALRFPFTKFSVLASFVYSILLAVFIHEIISIKKWILKNNIRFFIIISVFSLSLLYVYFPIFKGYLVNPRMRVSIPKEYFEMYDFFDSRSSEERVYLMPADTFWAWEYYNWGYRGSGFVWYGMKQPVLARAFDVWNDTNEKAYWEVSYAVSSRDRTILESVLDKYSIKWLVYDSSRIYPRNNEATEYSEDTKEYLDKLLTDTDIFISSHDIGFIKLYETKVSSSFIEYTESDLPKISTYNGLSRFDSAYINYGNYLNEGTEKSDIFFPYSHFASPRSLKMDSNSSIASFDNVGLSSYSGKRVFLTPVEIEIKSAGSSISLSYNYSILGNDEDVSLDILRNISLGPDDGLVFSNSYLDLKTLSEEGNKYLINTEEYGKNLQVFRSKSKAPFDLLLTNKLELSTCSVNESGSYSVEYNKGAIYLESSKDNPSVCIFTDFTLKPNPKSLRVLNLDFKSRDSVGRVCFLNKETKKCDFSQNFFYNGSYSVPILGFDNNKEYLIYFYSYPSSDASIFLDSYGSEFSNIYLEEKELVYDEEIKIPYIGNEYKKSYNNFDLKIDEYGYKTYFYKENDLAKLFRPCGCGESKMDFINDAGGLTFPIPSDRSLCLTILTDSMLPHLPFTGLVEINYEVSNKSQNVYVVQDGLVVGTEKFKESDEDKKLILSIFDARSLSINVELTSPGDSQNFLKIKSIKIIPLDLKSISLARYLPENYEIDMLSLEPLDYKGTNYVYKTKDVEKGTVIFNQSYSKDWVLMCSNLKCDPTHYEMNGWENAWNIKEPSKSIYIIYIPQVLGFVGFLTTFSVFLYVLFVLKKKDNF